MGKGKKRLGSLATSVFCENLAMMLAAGITSDEAIGLLGEDIDDGEFLDTVRAVEKSMGEGATLAHAIRDSGRFPTYVGVAVVIGEEAGRSEQTFRQLATFYVELDQVEKSLRSALIYPTVLLLVMVAILAMMLFAVLPAFTGVYQGLAGSVAASTYGYITTAEVITTVALIVTAVLAIVFATFAVLASSGWLLGTGMFALMQKVPFMRREAQSLVRARFSGTLATLISSGLDADEAFSRAVATVESPIFSAVCLRCETRMAQGESMAQAIYAERLFEPLYARMLISGARSGQAEDVLRDLSSLYYQEAREAIDDLIGVVEPTLAGFLTVAVGMSLLAIMLPLIGIMGGIG